MSALLNSAQVLIFSLVWLAVCAMDSLCIAQVILPNRLGSAEQEYRGVFLPSDRTLSRGIQEARDRISEGEFVRAIRFLDELLAPDKEDSFVVVGNTGEFAGLKSTSRQILRDLPLEGREAYETTFAPVARRELREAIEAGDSEALQQVAQRYFYTPAGYEAALLLAAYEADLGRHFSAALAYQQLIDTPEAAKRFEPQLSLMAALSWLALDEPGRALSLIDNLRSEGYQQVHIAGKDYQLNAMGEKPLEWLQHTVGTPAVQAIVPEDQWLTFRGNSARNGHVDGGLPHMRVRWQVRLLNHHKLEELHGNLTADLMRRQKAVPVAAAPLAVGDHIITRSAHNLVAIDFRTGKLVWQAEPQRVPELDSLVNVSGTGQEEESQVELSRVFSSRIWEDHLYNSLSSDGQRVYAIRDLSLPSRSRYDGMAMQFMNGRRKADNPAGSNRLCAFDLATQGKLVWEIDGAATKDDFEGAFFLGAPLAIGHSLYCLVEMKSAVYLTAIDRQSGQLLWRQQLANLETGILRDSQRRLQASMPSYDGGILICPTGAGVVVGVDLAKKALAWAYRYESNRSPFHSLRDRNSRNQLIANRWIDSAASVAEGRILLTPPESDFLHCLDLVTGKLLWKLPREGHLFVAGVDNDRILLVGNKLLTAVSLDTGEPVWQGAHLELPEKSVPTGRGFFSKGRYFLPLSSAEVVSIDMEQGAIVDRTVARDGQVLGNLICHRGAVLSQNGRFLDRFDQIDVLRSQSEELLVADPADANALRTLGEIAYNEGQLSQAIDLLQQSFNSSADDLRTREVLSEAMVIALDEDFASYRDRLPLLRRLQEASGNGYPTLLRLEARGLLEIGDPVGAFEVCLQLFAKTSETNELLSIGRHRQVEVSRWLRAQTSAIWKQAGEPEREQMVALLQELIDQLPEQPGSGEYRRLVDCMGGLDGVIPTALQLARKHAADGQALVAQQLFLALADSASEEIRAEAIASCSLALHQSDLHRLARPFDEALQTTFADVVCVEGKTGQEYLEQWGDAVGQTAWPFGNVEVKKAAQQSKDVARNRVSPQREIRLERCDGVLGTCNFTFSTTKGEVVGYDSLGKEFFRGTLADRRRHQGYAASQAYAVSRGNLLVVSFGRHLVAFDTMNSGKSGAVEPLWRREVTNALDMRNPYARTRITQQDFRPGTLRAPRSQVEGKWVGVIGPLTHDSCVFQNQRKLICVDSRTGEVRWTRSDVPLGCDLYGDENYVFAVAPSSRNAMVFSTVDGRSLGQVSAPRWQEQLATLGRNVIRWRSRADGRRELSCFDVFAGETIWEQDFEKNAKVDVAMGRYVAVVQPSGHCVIVDALDGQRLVDQEIAPSLTSKEIHLLAGSDQFVLAIQKSSSQISNRHIAGLNGFDYALIDGLIYVFDRHTGLPSWKRPAEVHRQALFLSQPVDAPVIAFVGNLSRRDKSGSKLEISMLLLEKATGRLLFSDDTLKPSRGNYCSVIASNTDAHEVIVKTSGESIRLVFTDQKRPPEPPAMGDLEINEKSGQKGLWEIGRKLIGGG